MELKHQCAKCYLLTSKEDVCPSCGSPDLVALQKPIVVKEVPALGEELNEIILGCQACIEREVREWANGQDEACPACLVFLLPVPQG